MKCSGIYTGALPELDVIKEGSLTRIFFNFTEVPSQDEDDSNNHYLCDNVDVEDADYPSIVAAIIRDRYTQDDVEAILSNQELCRDGDISEDKILVYKQRYEDYQHYRAMAKQIANEVINL